MFFLGLGGRKNYKNVFDAFLRIIKEEGTTTLWRGSVATMGRAAIVNISQLVTYSQAKIFFHGNGDYLFKILVNIFINFMIDYFLYTC